MKWIITGIFLCMHAVVHLLYLGQSRRIFELQPGLIWPDGSWAFSKLFGNETTRLLACILLALAAAGFVLGGIGLIARQAWWQPVTVSAAIFSTTIFLLLWDGKLQSLSEKGGVGILINAAILVIVLVLKWPGK